MAEQPIWKVGRLPRQLSPDQNVALFTAKNFRQNRDDIVQRYIDKLNLQKRTGELNDIEYINELRGFQNRLRGTYSRDSVGDVRELEQQAQENFAKQRFDDYTEELQRGLRTTLSAAEIKFAKVKDDYEKGKISDQAYQAQRDLFFNVQKELENFRLPKYSFEAFQPTAKINTYKSGRMRNIERERQIRNMFRQKFGADISGKQLENFAATYLPTSAIGSIFEQQKIAGIKAPKVGGYEDFVFNARGPGRPGYQFPGTGGAPGTPGSGNNVRLTPYTSPSQPRTYVEDPGLQQYRERYAPTAGTGGTFNG